MNCFTVSILFLIYIENDVDKIGSFAGNIDHDFNEKNHLLEDSNI